MRFWGDFPAEPAPAERGERPWCRCGSYRLPGPADLAALLALIIEQNGPDWEATLFQGGAAGRPAPDGHRVPDWRPARGGQPLRGRRPPSSGRRPAVLMAVNGRPAGPGCPLADGDRVDLVRPVSGGEPPEAGAPSGALGAIRSLRLHPAPWAPSGA